MASEDFFIGRPSIAPELMIRMLLVGCCFGIRSEPLVRRGAPQPGIPLFCRLGLDGDVPDHSTFSKNRHGRFHDSDLLRRLFETILRRCIDEGLVGRESFAVDASLIKAEANRQNGIEGDNGLNHQAVVDVGGEQQPAGAAVGAGLSLTSVAQVEVANGHRKVYSFKIHLWRKSIMKWIVPAFAAAALAVLSLSILSPVFTTEALADRMNGKGNCSGGVCTKVSCPPKTCGRMGTQEAYDVRFCSAANCKK